MQLDRVTGIIFDFDGTLATCPYDFAYMRQCILETAEEFGLERGQLDGFGLLESIAKGATLLGADTARSAEFSTLALRRLGEIEYEAAAKTRLLPGILEALQALRDGGYRMGIVTRNSTLAVQRILGDTVLPVEGIICRENIANPKPHLDHARAAMRMLNVQPVSALMVGDHPTDIQMGKAAGMATVAVLTGQTAEVDLREAEPDLVLPSVMVLAARLLGTTPEGSRHLRQESAAASE